MEIQKMKSNYGSGPRVGNTNPGGKRSAFKEGKAERSNLADEIKTAFALRSPTTNSKEKTYIDPTLEGVESDVKPKKFKR